MNKSATPFILLLRLVAVISVYLFLLMSASAHADWNHQERVDPLTDNDTSYVYSEAKECLSSYRCPFIIIRKNNIVVVNFSKFMKTKGSFRYFYRFDKEQAIETYMYASTSNVAGFIKDREINNGFIDKLKTHKKLVIVGYDYKNRATTLTFDLTGATEQINKLGE